MSNTRILWDDTRDINNSDFYATFRLDILSNQCLYAGCPRVKANGLMTS